MTWLTTSRSSAAWTARVAGGQDYEVRDFAEANNISVEQAQQLIERHGNSREVLERAVQQMKG